MQLPEGNGVTADGDIGGNDVEKKHQKTWPSLRTLSTRNVGAERRGAGGARIAAASRRMMSRFAPLTLALTRNAWRGGWGMRSSKVRRRVWNVCMRHRHLVNQRVSWASTCAHPVAAVRGHHQYRRAFSRARARGDTIASICGCALTSIAALVATSTSRRHQYRSIGDHHARMTHLRTASARHASRNRAHGGWLSSAHRALSA